MKSRPVVAWICVCSHVCRWGAGLAWGSSLGGVDCKGHEEIWGSDDMFIILIVRLFPQVYTHVKAYLIYKITWTDVWKSDFHLPFPSSPFWNRTFVGVGPRSRYSILKLPWDSDIHPHLGLLPHGEVSGPSCWPVTTWLGPYSLSSRSADNWTNFSKSRPRKRRHR